MLKLLRYLRGSKFPLQARLLPSPLPPYWGPKKKTQKTPKPEKLPEVPYSASAGLLAFATGPISKFTSSVLEHLHKRLVRQSRG